MESSMTNIHFVVALYDDGTMRCTQETLLEGLLLQKITPQKVEFDVEYNGPYGHPWGKREEKGLPSLKEEIATLPTTEGEWVCKTISVWCTL